MFRKIISTVVMFAFGLTSLNPAQAQMIVTPQIILPAVGAVVNVSKAFSPTLIKGLTVDQNDPFKFQFIMDTGDSGLEGEAFKNESYKMIKYFMASLATPENNMWVNLSPYEKDRIIPDVFGKTEMGRDLLAQDYILKQLTATLMSPENEEGKKFWEKIYTKIYESQSGKVSEFQNNKLSSMNSTHLSSSNVTHLSSSNVLVPSYRGLPKVVEDPASSVVKSKSNDSFDASIRPSENL